MIVLGIETSCDETALSLIDADIRHAQMHGDNPRKSALTSAKIRVLADKTLSQASLHARHGGVFPNLAKREHLTNLPVMLPSVLTEAGFSAEKPEIDAIAVTVGPGLEPCLWTGITFAEELSKRWSVPIVPVNHMEGHIFSALLRRKNVKTSSFELLTLNFPALALLISGGHTELVLMRNWFEYEIIGQTRDDAVGEAFDKVARLLGLPYPGGPPLSALATAARQAGQSPTFFPTPRSDLVLPRPMLKSDTLDFSFSGLKTAVLYLVQKLTQTDAPSVREGLRPVLLSPRLQSLIAREFEDAVTEVLIAKTKRAIERYGAKVLLIGGGVIANTHIRRAFENLLCKYDRTYMAKDGFLHLSEPSLTGDNALMIAVAGFLRLSLKDGSTKAQNGELAAKGNLRLDEK